MSELYLCRGETASMPYFIETAGVNIYSLEEMAFFIKENTELIDEVFISSELTDWVKDGLSDPELAEKLNEFLTKKDSENFIESLLIAGGILSREEILDTMVLLRQYKDRSTFERRKTKADGLIKKGRYLAAIREYEQLLESDEKGSYSADFMGKVWNNLGCACSGMFQFEKAAECFEMAYNLNGKEESKIFAERSKALRDGKEPGDEEALKIIKKISEDKDIYNTTLNRLKEEYRRYSG